jgi:voltage-gated potassium channel Kch
MHSSLEYNNKLNMNTSEISLFMAEEEGTDHTFKQHLDMFLSDGNKKNIIETISAFFSFFTFVTYISSTYSSEEDYMWFYYFDYFVCFYFLLEIAMNVYLAQHRWLYFLKVANLIDVFTATMPFLFVINNIFIKKLIEIARTFRVIRITIFLSKNMKNNENEVAKQITIIILTMLTLILIFTLVYRIAEIDTINYYIMHPDINSLDRKSQTKFHDFLYFIVVTLSTVGYGDIYPLTEQGRVVIVMLILLALILIPKQTNELIKLMSISSVYARAVYKSNPEVPHIVICGHVGVETLKNFCSELFHPDHGTQDKNAVIIQNSLPNQDMKVFLHAGTYEVSLKYLQGDPIFEKDLARCDILNSKACVIMTNKYTDDPHSIDHHNILLSLSIKKYFLYNNKNSQLFIQLIKPENKIHYQSGLQSLSKSHFNYDQVIIIEEIKMNLLSKSCLIPGIITMTSNLVMSAGSSGEDVNSVWVEEYTEGRGHEIYRTLLNDSFKNKTFSKLSSEIYQEYEAIVFALEIEIEGKTIIRLNPGTFNVEKLSNERDDVKIYIYIICSDKQVADRVRIYII